MYYKPYTSNTKGNSNNVLKNDKTSTQAQSTTSECHKSTNMYINDDNDAIIIESNIIENYILKKEKLNLE